MKKQTSLVIAFAAGAATALTAIGLASCDTASAQQPNARGPRISILEQEPIGNKPYAFAYMIVKDSVSQKEFLVVGGNQPVLLK